jgi:hypothetical protein
VALSPDTSVNLASAVISLAASLIALDLAVFPHGFSKKNVFAENNTDFFGAFKKNAL